MTTPKDQPSKEPAYTPRSEFNCDGSTTHYQGCKCHEARNQFRILELEEKNERLREDIKEYTMTKDELIRACLNCGIATDDLLLERLIQEIPIRPLSEAPECGAKGNVE